MKIAARLLMSLVAGVLALPGVAYPVSPGDVIGKDNAAQVADLLSPGNLLLVQQGMQMHVIPATKLEWPPPYQSATEKYASQVTLGADGEIHNYVAGLPFPLIDANDPQAAIKIMWNFTFRPLYTDDADLRFAEIASSSPTGSGTPITLMTVGHFTFYNNVGRIEVPPYPTHPDAANGGIRYRFGYFPVLEPAGIRGYGLLRYRHIDPAIEDNSWTYNPQTRRLRRQSPEILSDAIAALMVNLNGFAAASAGAAAAVTIDPDSYFGFSARLQDYSFRFLGEKSMLACVHARNSPAAPCPFDGGRTICPEDWEVRHIYAVEATAKPGHDVSIPRRILYIDSEGWFVTASDQFDRDGKLWKTIATFNAYRDRPVPDAKIAIYPYKRMFQVALVDQDVQTGYSSIIYMPGRETPERECWYINMGAVDNTFLNPQALVKAGH